MSGIKLNNKKRADYHKNLKEFNRLSHPEKKYALFLMEFEMKKLPFYRISFKNIITLTKEKIPHYYTDIMDDREFEIKQLKLE